MSRLDDGRRATDAFVGELRATFLRFLAGLAPSRPIAVLCHSDADGLAAGAILARALRRAGHAVAAEVTGRGEDAWAPAVAARPARHDPQALLVADLGSRDRPVLDGVPTLLIDHHRPDGVPPGATLITGYGREPTPTSGLLAYWAAGAVAEVDDLRRSAAISLLSDLGDDAPFAELAEARRRHKITPLRESTALLNAPRRSASGDAAPILKLLLEADGPRAIIRGTRPRRRPCGRPGPSRPPRSPGPSGWRRWSSATSRRSGCTRPARSTRWWPQLARPAAEVDRHCGQHGLPARPGQLRRPLGHGPRFARLPEGARPGRRRGGVRPGARPGDRRLALP